MTIQTIKNKIEAGLLYKESIAETCHLSPALGTSIGMTSR